MPYFLHAKTYYLTNEMGHKIEAIFTKQRHNSKVTVAERIFLIICQSELGFKRTCFSRSHIRLKSEQKN